MRDREYKFIALFCTGHNFIELVNAGVGLGGSEDYFEWVEGEEIDGS